MGEEHQSELGGESSIVGTNAAAGVPSRLCGGSAKIMEVSIKVHPLLFEQEPWVRMGFWDRRNV